MNNGIYNFVSLFFILLTMLTCVFTGAVLGDAIELPDQISPSTPIFVPEILVRFTRTPSPTYTVTNTPEATLTRTSTPTRTPTDTSTPTETATITPTLSPTVTQTATPSSTFTLTFTPLPPTETPTVTVSPTSTAPTSTPTITPAPFPFEIQDIAIRPDLADSCTFQGFGGNVFDLVGEPIAGLRIVVTGGTLPAGGNATTSDSNPNYGPGGWEVSVATAPIAAEYSIEIQASDGTPLSQRLTQRFSGSCAGNLVLIQFRQIRPIDF